MCLPNLDFLLLLLTSQGCSSILVTRILEKDLNMKLDHSSYLLYVLYSLLPSVGDISIFSSPKFPIKQKIFKENSVGIVLSVVDTGLPQWLAVENLPAVPEVQLAQFNLWVGRPLEEKWPPILVFSPGKSYGQRSFSGYSCGVAKSWAATEHVPACQRRCNFSLLWKWLRP